MTIRTRSVRPACVTIPPTSSRSDARRRLPLCRNLARRWSRELETKQALKEAYERVRASRLLQPTRDDQKLSSAGAAPASRASVGKADGDAPRRRSSTAHGGALLR